MTGGRYSGPTCWPMLLTSCVPLPITPSGRPPFGLYLFGACLSLFPVGAGHRRGLASEYHGAMLSVIGVLLTFSVFQLDGGLFSDPAFVFETEGVLLRVPLPVSLLAVFFGIALLGNYKTVSRSLTVLFFSALLLRHDVACRCGKGMPSTKAPNWRCWRSTSCRCSDWFSVRCTELAGTGPVFERAACWVLVIILPAQLVSTWLQGYVLLSPKVVLFSIYQHLQYFPMIVSALSILAVLSLWGARTGLRPWRGLMLISSLYVVAANSLGRS